MARLWQLMAELYGHKWTSVHGIADESGNWGKVLAGVDKYQLAAGIKVCTQSGDPWPPSAPEFLAMCRAGYTGPGIPNVDDAWREAVEGSSAPTEFRFSHPIVREAGRLTDWYSIRTGTPSGQAVQTRFSKRYADLTAKLQRGEPLIDDQKLLGGGPAMGQACAAQRAGEHLAELIAKDQGLYSKTPHELRQELLEKLGIKR